MNLIESFRNFLGRKPTHIVGIKESGIGLVGKDVYSASDTDDSENDIELIRKAIKIYNNFPLAKDAVDSQAEQAVTDFSFEGPDKDKLEKFSYEYNLSLHLQDVAMMLGKTGICFVEAPEDKNQDNEFKIKELKILDKDSNEPTLKIYRTITGKILGVSQEIRGKDALWGTTGKREKDAEFKKRKKLDRLIIYRRGPGKYGQPLVKPTMHLFEILDRIQGNLPNLVKRYANPIIHAKIGDEMNPPTSDDVDDVADMLEDIYSDTEYATSYLVNMDVLDFKGKGIDIAPLIELLQKEITKGLRQPVLEGNDGKLAEVKLKFSNRHVLALQRELKTQVEDKLFQKLLGLSNENKIMFENPDERDKEAQYDRLITLVQASIITPQKANDLLPERFREKLPEMDMAMMNNNPNNKNIGKQDNPTDPSKSAKAVPGRRIERTDKKASVDDEGENKKSRDKK